MSELATQYEELGFVIVNDFLPPVLVQYIKEYFDTLNDAGLLEEGDPQVHKSQATYGNPAFDTILKMATPMVSQIIGKELYPTYTYARIYHTGAELLPHLDRKECEHSFTLAIHTEAESLYPMWLKDSNNKESEIHLFENYPGSICIYQGTRMSHWRDEFLGTKQYQIFAHFVEVDGEYADQKFDTRPALGMPASTKTQWDTEE